MAAAAFCCITFVASIFTACTNDDNAAPAQERRMIHLTMLVNNVDDDDDTIASRSATRSVFYPTTGVVEFSDSDVIYLASNGQFIGTLTCRGGLFSGDVVEPSTEDYLHVFFLGNRNVGDLYPGDTECMVRINDQVNELPFICYGKSLTKYSDPDDTYSCILQNQCGIVEVDLYHDTEEDVILKGVNSSALIDFSDPEHPVTARRAKGDIKMYAADKKTRYALLLPQDSTSEVTMTIGDKEYAFKMPAIQAGNAYFGENAVCQYLDEPGYGTFTVTGGTQRWEYQRCAFLMDGDLNTEWCVASDQKQDGVWFVEFQSEKPFTPSSYRFVTGYDNGIVKNCNPKSWTLKAKLKEEDEWTDIATVADDDTMEDLEKAAYDFQLDVTGQEWQFFRLEVSDNHGADRMQIGEMIIYYKEGPEPEPLEPQPVHPISFTATGGGKSSYSTVAPEKMFDGNRDTYWGPDAGDRIDGVWYVEFCSYRPFVPTGYTLVLPEYRNAPTTWKLMAKQNANNGEWITIAEENGYPMPRADNVEINFNLKVTGQTWQYFRFEVNHFRLEEFLPKQGPRVSEFIFKW